MITYNYPPTEGYPAPQPPQKSLTGRQKAILGGVGAFLALAVAGAALNPAIEGEATAPPKAHDQAIADWRQIARDDLMAIGTTLIGIGESADAADYQGLWAGCELLGDQSSDALEDYVPTPDRVLTVEMEGAFVDLVDASTACRGVTRSSTEAEIQAVVDLLESATAHLDNASDLMNDAERRAAR